MVSDFEHTGGVKISSQFIISDLIPKQFSRESINVEIVLRVDNETLLRVINLAFMKPYCVISLIRLNIVSYACPRNACHGVRNDTGNYVNDWMILVWRRSARLFRNLLRRKFLGKPEFLFVSFFYTLCVNSLNMGKFIVGKFIVYFSYIVWRKSVLFYEC